ncbi:hypothetical protein AB4Z09_27680 [Rhodococcus sp. TAF43]|uniref:hypothetical protein n=1 Tax=Rhodococcus sp. TAF43 TaxID=3237483 RepID=UPI003F9B5C69
MRSEPFATVITYRFPVFVSSTGISTKLTAPAVSSNVARAAGRGAEDPCEVLGGAAA